MNIGFVGYGEAAFNISFGLAGEGVQGIRAHDAMMHHEVMGRQVHTRAEKAGVTLVESAKEVVDWADVVIVVVPPACAMDVCQEIKPFLRKGQLYADVSASTPASKQAMWETVEDTGVLFVDVAMLGSLPKDKHKVPITASGIGAEQFQKVMTPLGMNITLAGDKPGAASAIKLVRSIYMKGIAALMIEMLQAADAYGVADEVVASISKSMDNIPFTSHLDRLVTGSALHCVRRASELKGSIAMLAEAELSPEMTNATKHRLEALGEYQFAQKYVDTKPAGWQEIIEAIRVK